jgi:predicted metal-dependent hydrolase
MDTSSAPWWFAATFAPACAAAAYVWKQRDAAAIAERAKADAEDAADREERVARIAFLEAQVRASEEKRHAEHNDNRDKLLALYEGAIDQAGDLREAIVSVRETPAVLREGMETMTASMKLAIQEAADRISTSPQSPPTKGPRR